MPRFAIAGALVKTVFNKIVSMRGNCEVHDARFRAGSDDSTYDEAQRGRAREGVFVDAEWEWVPRTDEGSRFIE